MPGGPTTFGKKMMARSFNDMPWKYRRTRLAGGSGKSNLHLRSKAPLRSTFEMRKKRPLDAGARLTHAIHWGMVLGIVGGAIALFASGTTRKIETAGQMTTIGLVLAALIAFAGGVIAFYSKREE